MDGRMTPAPARIWRNEIEIDHPIQQIRVQKGCFCDELDSKGKPYNMCPKEEACPCEIFEDQIALGLPLEQLACQGALPREPNSEQAVLATPVMSEVFESV